MTMLTRQTSVEIRLWLRRRETVIFSLMLPVLFLAFFGAIYGSQKIHVNGEHIRYVNFIVPSYAVYAIMAVALGTVSANLANERFFKILKRLGGTPLPKWAMISSKVLAAGFLAAAVIVVLLLVGMIAYHVSLHGNQLAAVLTLACGIVTFSSIGIMLGGILKAEAAVAGGSLLYLAFSFLGGVFVPRFTFPSSLRLVSQYLPSERMVHAMQVVWTNGRGFSAVWQDLFVMGVWAAAALLISVRQFKWE